MNMELKNSLTAADNKSEYDECAKRIVALKPVLANILARTVEDFKGMNPEDIMPLIEGEPKIGIVPVDPGLTNAADYSGGERIVGLNTESTEINEGVIRFDIIFYVHTPDGLAKIIVNVECQKDMPSAYDILNRAIYFVCRMISSQKERDFTHSNYDDIKKVYSIWLVMNMKECGLDYIHLTNDKLTGNIKWKGNLDLLNIIMIGLPKYLPEKSEEHDLHRLLTTLLSRLLPVEQKLKILEEEYGITNQTYESEVNTMCNLSEGIYEEGFENGSNFKRDEIILNLYKKGISLEVIAGCVELSIEEVKDIISAKINEN